MDSIQRKLSIYKLLNLTFTRKHQKILLYNDVNDKKVHNKKHCTTKSVKVLCVTDLPISCIPCPKNKIKELCFIFDWLNKHINDLCIKILASKLYNFHSFFCHIPHLHQLSHTNYLRLAFHLIIFCGPIYLSIVWNFAKELSSF